MYARAKAVPQQVAHEEKGERELHPEQVERHHKEGEQGAHQGDADTDAEAQDGLVPPLAVHAYHHG